MYITEKEIFSQHEALAKTLELSKGMADKIKAYFDTKKPKRVIFIGCGSSYSLSKSASAALRMRCDIPAYAYSAGDLLVGFDRYKTLLSGSVLIPLSRSGSTSEVVMLCKRAQEELGTELISICAKEGSALAPMAALNVEIPWAFDESVCQTRCVTNLYLASMALVAAVTGDAALMDSLGTAVGAMADYMAKNRDALAQVAKADWNNIVVLADGELEGIAEEASLAFTEISLLPSRYYHVLDVRHGPVVLIDAKTLVLIALSPGESEHQSKLVADIKARGATVVVFTPAGAPASDAVTEIVPAKLDSYAAYGVPFIFIAQATSFFKALERGNNPDQPAGLDPWIKL